MVRNGGRLFDGSAGSWDVGYTAIYGQIDVRYTWRRRVGV